jgi:hypothetical protein
MKIYFKNTWTTNDRMNDLVARANSLMNEQHFIDEIARVDAFSMSDATPKQITEFITVFPRIMQVKFYRGHRFSRALGKFYPSRPFEIHINSRKLGRSDGSIVATMVHELIHAIDRFQGSYSFGHGDNKWTPAKEYTAPYYIDKIAEAFIDDKPIHEGNIKDNKKIKTFNKRFVWYKPWSWF